MGMIKSIDNPPIGQRPHRVGSRERGGRARFHCLDCGREDVTVMDRPCKGPLGGVSLSGDYP